MPYEWLPPTTDIPARLRLWPYRSLRPAGFVWFIALTAALIAVPLLTALASPVFWGLLPFVVATLVALWWGLQRSNRDRSLTEDLILSPDLARLIRQEPRGRRREWQANPYWVQVHLHRTGGPVPNYLTLRGAGREVEIGAFLSEAERLRLHGELLRALADCRRVS